MLTKTVYFIGLGLIGCNYAIAEPLDRITEFATSMDLAWLIITGALVFFMQAGFALLESGMSRAKNAINVIMKNYADACLGTILFWLFGFGIMFGSNPTGWFGIDHFAPNDLKPFDYAFLFFQTMFAATAVTIASGAMAERTRFYGYLIGSIVVTAIIYPIFGSWVWGGYYGGSGWLAEIGFIDFAGSTVVHSVGGWVALAGIIVLGPRSGRYSKSRRSYTIPGHNLTLVALGGFILWLGWFGFNGGSTLAINSDIGLITLNTQLAASAGAIGTLLLLTISRQPVYVTTVINGGIAGLVAITAGCATMEPYFALLTGAIASLVLIVGSNLLESFRLDDVVGAVSVHAFCGAWGTVAAGIFVSGDLFNIQQIIIQMVGVIAAFLWAFPVALIMYVAIEKTIGLRVPTSAEQCGLDFFEHFEVGYPEFQNEILHDEQPQRSDVDNFGCTSKTDIEKRRAVFTALHIHIKKQRLIDAMWLWESGYSHLSSMELRAFVDKIINNQDPKLLANKIHQSLINAIFFTEVDALAPDPLPQMEKHKNNFATAEQLKSDSKKQNAAPPATVIFEAVLSRCLRDTSKISHTNNEQLRINLVKILGQLALNKTQKAELLKWLQLKQKNLKQQYPNDVMKNLLNNFYINCCELCGATQTDTLLANAIKDANKLSEANIFPPKSLL